MALNPNGVCHSRDGKVLALWLKHVYDAYTKYRKDYAIVGETLSYAQFRSSFSIRISFIGSNVQKRIGSDNRRCGRQLRAVKARCDVSALNHRG